MPHPFDKPRGSSRGRTASKGSAASIPEYPDEADEEDRPEATDPDPLLVPNQSRGKQQLHRRASQENLHQQPQQHGSLLKIEGFGELLQKLASCHEQQIVEKDELRSQVSSLVDEVSTLRSLLHSTETQLQQVCPDYRERRKSSRIMSGQNLLDIEAKTEAHGQAVHGGHGELTVVTYDIEDWAAALPASIGNPAERWVRLCKRLLGWRNGRGSFEDTQNRYRLLPHWRGTETRDQPLCMAFGQLVAMGPGGRKGTSSMVLGTQSDETRDKLGNFVINPASWKRLCWVVLGVIFLTWDALIIPVQLFPLGELFGAFVRKVGMSTSVYWAVDLPMQCFISFQHADGTMERRPSRIALQYARTWMPLDVSVIMVDVVLFSLEGSGGATFLRAGRTFRLARLIRLLRVVRLVRLRKLNEFLGLALSRIKSEHMVLGIKLARHVALILLVNHYIACAWYAIASFHDEISWMDVYAGESAPTETLYVMALHWSMTQFSPATNNISPVNAAERLFAVCVVLFALIMFSSFISSVTNTVNELRRMNEDAQREEIRIREFLFARKVSHDLVGRILNFFKQNYRGRQKRIHEEDIPFFQDVPESMKIRLHEEAYMPIMANSAIFSKFLDLGGSLQVQVCHTSFSELFYLPLQDVFVAGTPSSGSYFVRSGKLLYHSIMGEDLEEDRVAQQAWISEMTLLVEWNHCGQLVAETSSELVKLDKTQFNSLVAKAGGPFVECLRRFAVFVLGHIESLGPHCPVTDLTLGPRTLDDLTSKARKLYELENRTSKRGWSTASSSMCASNSQLTLGRGMSILDDPDDECKHYNSLKYPYEGDPESRKSTFTNSLGRLSRRYSGLHLPCLNPEPEAEAEA